MNLLIPPLYDMKDPLMPSRPIQLFPPGANEAPAPLPIRKDMPVEQPAQRILFRKLCLASHRLGCIKRYEPQLRPPLLSVVLVVVSVLVTITVLIHRPRRTHVLVDSDAPPHLVPQIAVLNQAYGRGRLVGIGGCFLVEGVACVLRSSEAPRVGGYAENNLFASKAAAYQVVDP